MNPIKKIIILLIISNLQFISAQKDKSFDFTVVHLFTKGIEGPAVDSKGNLFAVNFKGEGTIGIVDSKGNPSLYTI